MVIAWNELRDARERIGLTQEELAQELGVSTRTITNWEKSGVARKAEYKVERYFGDALVRDTSTPNIERELDYLDAVRKMPVADRADHEGWDPSRVLREASDAELLEELTRRARRRGLIAVSKETALPRETEREARQILRGERARLTPADVIVGSFGENSGTEQDEPLPENLEEAWAGQYAADPAGDDPEDHTP